MKKEIEQSPVSDFPEDLCSVLEQEFDSEYYRLNNADIANNSIDPLEHYAFTGWSESRDPCKLFSSTYYLSEYPDVKASGLNPFYHYLKYGRTEGRFPLPASGLGLVFNQLLEILEVEFDSDYYASTNPDVVQGDIDLLRHFAHTGWREGRNPSERFNVRHYVELAGDSREDSVNPLYHFLIYGQFAFSKVDVSRVRGEEGQSEEGQSEEGQSEKGRSDKEDDSRETEFETFKNLAEGYFDSEYYLTAYPDVGDADVDPLEHFFWSGWKELRNPSHSFNTDYYLRANPGIAAANINPLYHYILEGKRNGLVTQPPGGYKGVIAFSLKSLDERREECSHGLGVPSVYSQLSSTELEQRLTNSRLSGDQLILAFSHDDYKRVVGGVQLCMAECNLGVR